MKKMTCIIIALLIQACALSSITGDLDEQDGIILMGFVLKSMTNKGKLTDRPEVLSSITLKNVDTGERYTINFTTKSWGLLRVRPGTYCITRLTTYVNFSMNLCKGDKFDVLSGQVKNVGYWIAGIHYEGDRDRIEVKLFDRTNATIDLFEQASESYADYLESEFLVNHKINIPDSIVGYWYSADSTDKTYLFNANGDFYTGSSNYKNGLLERKGHWVMKDNIGNAKLSNKYGEYKLKQDKDKLYIHYENKNGLGQRMVAYRNPFRIWSYESEFNSVFAEYFRGVLEKIIDDESKDIVIKIKFDTFEQKKPYRIGKRVLSRVKNAIVISSNIGTEKTALILEMFENWRFGSIFTNKMVTLCMIEADVPSACKEDNINTLVIRKGVAFPVETQLTKLSLLDELKN